jgi:hypothetical protein
MKERPDIFGLHSLTLIGEACLSDAERAQRHAKVEAGIAAAFKAAVVHVGDARARELFRQVMRRPKRGAGKAHAPDRDSRLLKAYDEAVRNKESVRALAKRLHAGRTGLGNTPGAIETHIRKLVKERTKRARAAAVQARRWRMATRGIKTLASGFLSEK